MPMSITGRHGGSYRKHNPNISQTIESLKLICQQLNESPKNWWISPSVLTSIEQIWMERRQEKKSQGDDDDDEEIERDCEKFGKKLGQDIHHNPVESNVVGLSSKANDDSGRFSTTTNDHDDVASIDSDDSLWNRGRKRKDESQQSSQ
jgi:hypothetical protein